jgi:AcrR family transcriptional regulator
MGRRSSHTPEELRELILEASTDLIKEGGLAALSAREVAKRIGYSPGTLYNVFENLDDLVLTIEGRLLDRLSAKLSQVRSTGSPDDHVLELARVYLRFTHDHPRLWNLLFEHHLPANRDIPAWYQQKLDGLMGHVEAALAPVMPGSDQDKIRRAASVLWAGVHGITSPSTADKLSVVTTESANHLVDDLVRSYLRGLAVKSPA